MPSLATVVLAGFLATSPRASASLLDLDGAKVDPFEQGVASAFVFFFLSSDCPVSNTYAPEIRRLSDSFAKRGVVFYLIYPSVTDDRTAILRHLREFALPPKALRDPSHDFVKRSGATVTPEVVVFSNTHEIVYRGRIDDRYVDFGVARPTAKQHDLETTLLAVLQGSPAPTPRTKAVGCYIEDLK